MKKIFILFLFAIAQAVFAYEDTLSVEETMGKIEGSRLDELVEKYLAIILMYDPEKATELGIHDGDDNLTEREYGNWDKYLSSLKLLMKDVERIDKDVLNRYKRTEYDLLYSSIHKEIYDIEKMKILSTRPHYYLKPFDIVYFMMSKDYANYNLRAQSAYKRFVKIPDILYQAERNLQKPPKIWTEYTIKRTQLLLDNISEYYPLFKNYIGLDPTLKAEFENNINKIKDSLERYKNYLEKDVLKKSTGKPQVGLYTYGYYLEMWHKIYYNPRKALSTAKKIFKKTYKELEEEAVKINSEEFNKKGIKGVYNFITGEHPKFDTLIKYVSDEIDNAKNHFDEYKVVRFPSQRLLIKNIPEFFNGVYPTVFYYPAYPLDRERVSELYIFANEKYGEDLISYIYCQPKIEFYISELIIPGLHTKNDYLKELPKIRRIISQPQIEGGWAIYSNDLAWEMGYYSTVYSRFLLSYLKALKALRAYIDVAFHIEEISFEEGSQYFKEKFGFTDDAANLEMINISFNPTYYYAQVYGYTELVKLRNKYVGEENKFFDMREFHTDVLTRGNIPFDDLKDELKLIRKEKIKARIEEETEEE
jgi:uncharacterized protein (DUF885 family)